MTLDQHPRVAGLVGGPLGWHTVRHESEVTSTNDVAVASAHDGVPPGLVVVADHQTAGRGRQGRIWDDANVPGGTRSLTVSVLVAAPAVDATLLPLAAGLAVADALRRAGASPQLKWPNDVLLPTPTGPAKVAGTLVERHQAGASAVVVIGCGIDLDWRDVRREGEAGAWTSLAEVTGADVDRGDVLADLLRGLAVWNRAVTTDPDGLLAAYRAACATLGGEVEVVFPDGEVLRGRAIDLDRTGRLVVVSPTTGRVAVTAGDVTHVRPT